VNLTEIRHRAYARRFGFDYERFDGSYASLDWTRHWDGWTVCGWLLEAGVRWLVWIDADAIIVRDEDLREAVGEGLACDEGIGVVRHPGPPAHWNVGVMVIRNSERVRAFWREVIEWGPGEWPWYQQTICNTLWESPKWADLVRPMPDRYNSTWGVNWVEDAVIRAWHGQPGRQKKLEGMQAYLARRRQAMPLEELYLNRARLDLLREAGMQTIGDVAKKGTGELMSIPGIGRTTVELLRRRIGELV